LKPVSSHLLTGFSAFLINLSVSVTNHFSPTILYLRLLH
jgi:hypothetical protein